MLNFVALFIYAFSPNLISLFRKFSTIFDDFQQTTKDERLLISILIIINFNGKHTNEANANNARVASQQQVFKQFIRVV